MIWFLSLTGLFGSAAFGQVKPVYDQGAIGLGQLLKRLGNTKTVMHTGAHPDDEDSDLLAYLARAENARTVYLALTRGDGGQNVIGPELFESLGVIRSEELLQARRLDGGEQLFTRAFDYGYSKTLAEARAKWDEQIVLCDVVRAIRTFRPLVVISRFSGTRRDGHGQHQFAGYIVPPAIEAAADPERCKELHLPAWQVLKFYVGQGFRDREEPDLRVNTGRYDFLLGRSYYEIAAEGRSQHKTQEQGALELKGDRYSGVNLVWSKAPRPAGEPEKSVFAGIDTSLPNYPQLVGAPEGFLREELKGLEAAIRRARDEYRLDDLKATRTALLEAKKIVSEIIERSYARLGEEKGSGGIAKTFYYFLRMKTDLKKAIRLASGLQIDALADRETVTPGEEFLTSVKIFFPENAGITIKKIEMSTPEGWPVAPTEEPQSSSPFARFFRETAREAGFFKVRAADAARYTQPYFLENERRGYLYQWPSGDVQNKPFQEPFMSAEVTASIDGTEITFRQPVEYRYADDTRGEVRRNLHVVPAVSLKLDQDLLVFPQSGREQQRRLILSVKSNAPAAVEGTAELELPAGWRTEQNGQTFELGKRGESRSFAFDVSVPAGAETGDYRIGARVRIGGKDFTQTMNEIAYPHIQTHRFYTPAAARAEVIDLRVADVRVGYVPGSGDRIPEAVRQMGLEIEVLDEDRLTNEDFSRFDVIVVGIRASEVNPAFVANNGRLLDYARRGGTLIVQYQKWPYLQQNLAPFPAEYNARVSEEDAPVKILRPAHPVFNFPNRITDEDFRGWVQERNLYAFRKFDPRYTPLLEAHDTGEEENKGAMLYAEIGRGKYMYVSYAFFRQLPAGVPGAYRLFANILSLPKADQRAN